MPGTSLSKDERRAVRVAEAFLTPTRRPKRWSVELLPFFHPFWVAGPLGKVAAIHLGEGPAVLLVHGWEGEISDFSTLIPCLLAVGHRVIAMDLPAHGASEGTMAPIPACAASVLAVQRAVGRLHAVIGHSVGATIAAEAASLGLDAPRIVFLSAAARYEDYARRFGVQAGLNAQEVEEMLDGLEMMGSRVRSISLPRLAPSLRQRALFLHSKNDKVVPPEDGRESAALWPGARFLEFAGLGHRGILRSPAVLEAMLKFIAE